jgi:hypothetical protein
VNLQPLLVASTIALLTLNACGPEPEVRCITIAVDASGSTINSHMRDQYEQDVDLLLKNLMPGDLVSADAVSNNPLPKTFWPAWSIPSCGVGESQHYCLAKAKQPIAEIRSHLKGLLDSETRGSAIVETVLAAAKAPLANPACSEEVLVLLSDGIEESSVANFRDIELDEANIAEILDQLRQNDLLPDLGGVTVWIAGATAVGADESDGAPLRFVQGVEGFWRGYADATGADLACYGTRLRPECLLSSTREARVRP